MPWQSAKQERWGNSPAGKKALGAAGVAEWNAASKGKKFGPRKPAVRTGKNISLRSLMRAR